MSQAAFQLQLQGFTPANRDVTVKLIHEATGKVVERKPFLDGSLSVRELDPGNWDLEVTHPNLVAPIERRRVRLFPQRVPTFIPVRIPEALFRDTPIRDIPDANLTPVQQAASSVRDRVMPLQGKAPGEVIRSSDWNALTGAVADLASAVLELTQLVSPHGHAHLEIAEKIDQVQGNVRRFIETFGRSLLELRREIETEGLRQNLVAVLDAAGAGLTVRDRMLSRVNELEKTVQGDTTVFTRKLSSAGDAFLSEINELAVGAGADGDAFLERPDVQQFVATARQYREAGTQHQAELELLTYQRTATTAGGAKISPLLRR